MTSSFLHYYLKFRSPFSLWMLSLQLEVRVVWFLMLLEVLVDSELLLIGANLMVLNLLILSLES